LLDFMQTFSCTCNSRK